MAEFDFYNIKAAHSSETDFNTSGNSEPYSINERKAYCKEKSNSFHTSDIGKYVICQSPRKKKEVVLVLYLVDRSICKDWWWSQDSSLAMIFEDERAAQIQAQKYKYNNVRVEQITPAMVNCN